MSELLGETVVDPELYPWVMPDFSTTTENDQVVASVVMMGALQKYFEFGFELACGIPSVTLLGVKEDWMKLLERVEKIPNLGAEAGQFHGLLKPVLGYFVRTFDEPEGAEVKSFWSRVADKRSYGSGPNYLSGWITAFCFWDADGKLLYTLRGKPTLGPEGPRLGAPSTGCDLDGTLYHCLDIKMIPPGSASVPVTVNDHGTFYQTAMVAGSMGIRVSSSGERLDESSEHAKMKMVKVSEKVWVPERIPWTASEPTGEPGLDSLQPEVGWIMYEKVEENEVDEEELESKVGLDGDDQLKNNKVKETKSVSASLVRRMCGKGWDGLKRGEMFTRSGIRADKVKEN